MVAIRQSWDENPLTTVPYVALIPIRILALKKISKLHFQRRCALLQIKIHTSTILRVTEIHKKPIEPFRNRSPLIDTIPLTQANKIISIHSYLQRCTLQNSVTRHFRAPLLQWPIFPAPFNQQGWRGRQVRRYSRDGSFLLSGETKKTPTSTSHAN